MLVKLRLENLNIFLVVRVAILKRLRHGILRHLDHRQNYLEIEGNMKIILYKDRKNAKEITINHKGTRMVKDGED